MKKKVFCLFISVMITAAVLSAGCGTVAEDFYSLDHIDGDIICEYRTGKNAVYADECVDTDVVFDKDKFIELFHESNQYDPVRLSKHKGPAGRMGNHKRIRIQYPGCIQWRPAECVYLPI